MLGMRILFSLLVGGVIAWSMGETAYAACPPRLQNDTTANADQVMAWFDCKALHDDPTFNGIIYVEPPIPFYPASIQFTRASMGPLGATRAAIYYQHNGGISGTNEALVLDTGTSGNDYRFKTGGNDRLIINGTNGNVGLGVAPTLGRLQINGTGNQVLAINSSDGDDSTIRLYRSGTMRWRIYNNGANDTLTILDQGEDNGVFLPQNGTGWTGISDERLKRNVRSLAILERLSQFRAVSFDWRKDGRSDVGVIAQELDKAFPEVVYRGDARALPSYRLDQGGIWSVDYSKLGALALGGVKELHVEVSTLRALVQSQAAEIRRLQARQEAFEKRFLVQTAMRRSGGP